VKLRDYQVTSISTGEDAQGEVAIEVEHASGVYRSRALSTDIIEGSARAFLDVMNRIALKVAPPRVSEARAEMGTP
jgi:2-isopropylmalate synthase